MVSVPAFLLRRLYVKGSLHNRQDGLGKLRFDFSDVPHATDSPGA